LLARTGLNVRPVGGSGDRGRDAVVGLYRADAGEDFAITISLNASWSAKIVAGLKRIHGQGFKPRTVVAVTSRPASASTQIAVQQRVKKLYGVDLRIYDRRWLITQMHLRKNLDLRGEFLNLPAPRPRFFLDVGEFEQLLQRRGMLAAPCEGRTEDMESSNGFLLKSAAQSSSRRTADTGKRGLHSSSPGRVALRLSGSLSTAGSTSLGGALRF
jgi:hypothetical protein